MSSNTILEKFSLDDILSLVNLPISNFDPYLNHISWSPCSSKFLTLVHYSCPNSNVRKIFPLIYDTSTKSWSLIDDSSYFSHHTWIDKDNLLAYLSIEGQPQFAVFNFITQQWTPASYMPSSDGHPTFIKDNNSVLVDSYPERDSLMQLYTCSVSNGNQQTLFQFPSHPMYKGDIRCDFHPRYLSLHRGIVIDIPAFPVRKICLFSPT